MRAALAALLAVTAFSALAAETEALRATQSDGGIVVGLALAGGTREGETARVTVTLHDQASHAPLRGVYPSAWMSARGEKSAGDRRQCAASIAAYLSGTLFTRADVDLNTYDVAVLNADATITVVDPRFSFGGSSLRSLVRLPAPGRDWVLGADGTRLFVAMPDANAVAVVDTTSWSIVAQAAVGPKPSRVVLQPDAALVWAAHDDGVTAMRPTGQIAARIATERGPHDLAVSDDGRFVIVTNAASATVIDARALRVERTVALETTPRSLAWSPLSRMAYAAGADGTIVAFDPAAPQRRATIATEPGLRQFRFTNDGRFGFAVISERDLVLVLDAATNRVIQRGRMEGGPFAVSFTDTLAYIRLLHSEVVLMVPLADLGKPGRPIPVAEFPAGREPFGESSGAVAADGIVATPGEAAVLVAHPGDRNVYYYREGMAAPNGHFVNAGHEPRAVLPIDRTLRAVAPGVFSTSLRLPRAGAYRVAVLVDSPRAVACFDVTVAGDTAAHRGPVVQHLTTSRVVAPGGTVHTRFRILDPGVARAIKEHRDADVFVVHVASGWSERTPLRAAADGIYEGDVSLPREGIYYAYVESRSAGLQPNGAAFLVLEAR
jgi:DNA-binding beta-propeller fold protein YncE